MNIDANYRAYKLRNLSEIDVGNLRAGRITRHVMAEARRRFDEYQKPSCQMAWNMNVNDVLNDMIEAARDDGDE